MQSVPKRVFTHEYRAEAIKLVLAEGLGVSEAARKLGLSVKTYSKWTRDARSGVLARLDTFRTQPVSDLQTVLSVFDAPSERGFEAPGFTLDRARKRSGPSDRVRRCDVGHDQIPYFLLLTMSPPAARTAAIIDSFFSFGTSITNITEA